MQKLDSDRADDKETRQSCSGGAVLFHGCAVLTRTRTQKTRTLSSAEAELYGIDSGAIEVWEQHKICKNGSTGQYRFFRQTRQAHLRCANVEDGVG